MSLTLRTITNTGAPLCSPDGAVLKGIDVLFTLVDTIGQRVNGWDAVTLEDVGSIIVKATTNDDGEFSVGLWPTGRASRALRYRCEVSSPGFTPFTAPLPEGASPVQWAQFMTMGVPLTPQEITQLQFSLDAIAADRLAAEQAAIAATSAKENAQTSAYNAGVSESNAGISAAAYGGVQESIVALAANLVSTQALIASIHPIA